MAKQTLIEKLRKLALIESHKDEVKMQQHPAWKAAKRLERAEEILKDAARSLYASGEISRGEAIDDFLAEG